MHRYLVHLLAAILVLLLGAAAVNWLADPYAVFGTPVIQGVNAVKPERVKNERIFKMVGLAHEKMEAVILGTSRTDYGLNPGHEGFKKMRTISLAMAAETDAETAAIFKFVANHAPLKAAVIGLDFFASNAYMANTPDFSLDNFSDTRKLELLFSVDTVSASIKTLFKPDAGAQGLKPDTAVLDSQAKFDKRLFMASERAYMWGGLYLPNPGCEYSFETDKYEKGKMHRYSPLEEIRSVIAEAHKRHIKLYLFISPSHARQWEALAAVGLWDKWEEWKRRLVRINEEEAVRSGQPPFPLWDFSGYNSITTEALPVAGEGKTEMDRYRDSSHYKPIVGDLLLDRVFGVQRAGQRIPDDFGVRVNSANIDSHLANIRTARQLYRQAYPLDVAEIRELERESYRSSHCPQKQN